MKKYLVAQKRMDGSVPHDYGEVYIEEGERCEIVEERKEIGIYGVIGYIIKVRNGYKETFNTQTRLKLMEEGLVNQNDGLWFVMNHEAEKNFSLVTGNPYNCIHNCPNCEKKCELWEEEIKEI